MTRGQCEWGRRHLPPTTSLPPHRMARGIAGTPPPSLSLYNGGRRIVTDQCTVREPQHNVDKGVYTLQPAEASDEVLAMLLPPVRADRRAD